MAKLHAFRFASVFAANSKLDSGPRLAAQIAGDFHQPPNAFLVDRRERIRPDDIKLCVGRQDRSGIIMTYSESCLREIVRPEAEEFRVARNFIGHERGSRDLDHRADEIVKFRFLRFRHLRGDSMHDLDLKL